MTRHPMKGNVYEYLNENFSFVLLNYFMHQYANEFCNTDQTFQILKQFEGDKDTQHI